MEQVASEAMTEALLFRALDQYETWLHDARGDMEIKRLEAQIMNIKSMLAIFHAGRLPLQEETPKTNSRKNPDRSR